MTDEQIKMLRFLIQQEIEYAQMKVEDDVFGWVEEQSDEYWKKFQDSFNEN